MGDDEPMTLGELGRLMKALTAEVREDRRNFLAVQVWEVEKRALEERDRAMGREVNGLRSTLDNLNIAIDHENKALANQIQGLREENRVQAEQARKDRARVWVSIGLAVLGGVIAVFTGVTVATLNQIISGGV